MEERTTGPAFTRQEQRVNQLAAQYVELVNRGQDRNSERLTALSTQIWLGTVEAMERTLGGRALDQERRIANSGRDYEEQDLKMELLTELTSTVTALDDELDQVYDELDAIDEDMDDLEEAVYGDEDDDEENGDEDDEAQYELTCPKCGAVTVVDEEALMSEQIHCQNCGAAFDIEFGVCDPEDAPCEPAEDEE